MPNIDEIRLYVDGQLKTVSAVIRQSINTSAANDVAIGGFASSTSPLYFNGLINDARIYDHALTQAEIKLAAGLPNSPPMVDAGPDQSIKVTYSMLMNATVTDDSLPDPPGE